MSMYLVAVSISVWSVSAAVIYWVTQPEGHRKWWPMWCAYFFRWVPQPVANTLRQPLILAGYSSKQVESWFGRVVVTTLLGGGIIVAFSSFPLQLGGAALLIYVWLPYLNAGRHAKRRQQEAVYALPVVMDGLAMLLVTGVPLVSALQRSMSQHKSHALQEELQVVLQDIRMGTSLAQALEGLCQRLPRPEIRLFANLLLQSSQQGNSLAPLLEQQAKVRREVTTADLEQYAQEAPVRLLGPLALCIFPATILPFIGVIVMKVSNGL
ncbi:hypothetical protein CWE15_01660 [Aliidiomarina taiwanensis]|uniref:Type II secretion system protein GspF domain-containing protein n=1 Tax=Aliidiomarina taiwanensis TaxID=946228 RepID=A0A432X953_9GAMM|nr:type II secretion system F family protein [Aliidiomarina taiwanensis]RUO43917.1 hypothetical protein CWE15_01660 [Aliidiomarina taiwanensis]